MRELFAEGEHLLRGVHFASGGIARLLAGQTEVVEQAGAVGHFAGQKCAGGSGQGRIVAAVSAAGAVQNQPGQFVFFAHRLVGDQADARLVQVAQHFHACADGRIAPLRTDVQVGLADGADKRNNAFFHHQILPVGFVLAADHVHAAHGLNVAGGRRFERELAAQRYFQPFAAEMEFVVQIEYQIQIERHGFGGFGFGFAQNDHVVVQRGRIAFLKTEAAFVGDQFAVQSEAVVAVQHFGGAGHGELAVHLVEHGIAFEHHLRIDIRRAVGERGAAGKRYRTVFARKLQAVHQPAVTVQMRFERAVFQNDADLAVAVA